MVAKPTKATGNAHITIPDTNGKALFDGDVWVASFQTNLYTQYDNGQTRRGMYWFPIRRNEVMINFSIIWPFNTTQGNGDYNSMQAFQDAIRQSQQGAVLGAATPYPMTFTYYNASQNVIGESSVIEDNLPIYGNNPTLLKQVPQFNGLQPLVYQGWIDTADKNYNRFKSAYVLNYRMNVLNSQGTTSQVQVASTGLTPNTLSVQQYGFQWAGINTSNGQGINTGQIMGSDR